MIIAQQNGRTTIGAPDKLFGVSSRAKERIAQIGKENVIDSTIGVLLNDEILEFVNKEMGNMVLSIDGRKEVHDRMRPHRGGQGSYDEIVPKFKKAAESRGQMNYYVRGTYTHYNTDFAKDVLHLADLGFKQISVEPVVAPETEDYAIR